MKITHAGKSRKVKMITKDIPTGTVFSGYIDEVDKDRVVFMKMDTGVANLCDLSESWLATNRFPIYDYKEYDAELILKEKL